MIDDVDALIKEAQALKGRGHVELMAAARALDGDSAPDEVDAIVLEAVTLKPTAKRQLFNTIKKHTGIPLGTLKEAEQSMANHDVDDDLAHACALASEIGRDNVITTAASVMRWSERGFWQQQESRAVRQWVQGYLSDNGADVRKSVVDSVTDLLLTETYQPELEFNQGPAECVNCPNGELMLSADGWKLEPHNREHYRTTQVPVKFDPNATAPRFQQFLAEVFKGDDDVEQKVQALLEAIGYSLMAHCNYELFVILVGGGANGKSVLLAVLEALAGSANVAGVQPSRFDNPFQRAHLHLKLVNIVTEIKQGEKMDDASLKGIVSGEPATVEHKFRNPFEMRPFSTCWFGTNHMPHTRDFSDGLFRRALVVEFNNKFKPELGNCDPLLREKLMAELPGILNLALNAYAGVVARGAFTIPESCKAARNRWRLEADQVAQFVDDECEVDPIGRIEPKRLFNAYSQWATESGISKKLSLKGFSDRLEALGFQRYRTGKARYITGIDCQRATAPHLARRV
ncbi:MULTISPECIES: phage/plasmid primase, P4 family [unclassified Alcanivorax]|nr:MULTISPECIES: DNA primase family protein [unclassified Alcanivorax]